MSVLYLLDYTIVTGPMAVEMRAGHGLEDFWLLPVDENGKGVMGIIQSL